jgi:Galactosyltransferase
MKPLLAIINCHSRPEYQQAIRDIWLPKVPKNLDYRFFLGPSDRTQKGDEVFLKCRDEYEGLPSKVQAAVRWALDHEYTHIAKCDDDVVLRPDRFMHSGFWNNDFVGNINTGSRKVDVPWGFFYTLSKKAMELVAISDLPKNGNDEAWIADLLYLQGTQLSRDKRYQLYFGRKELLTETKKRALREVPRPVVKNYLLNPQEDIAYCVHVDWAGFKEEPHGRNIEEMKRLFGEITQ